MYEFIDINNGAELERVGRLRTSIQTILTTPLGSMVMRRDYGSNIYKLIDQNVTQSWLTSLYAEAAAAISRWEPDFMVTGFQPVMTKSGQVTIHIYGIDTLSNMRITLENINL